MIEHLLDEHAQNNAISHISPVTKILLAAGTLILILLSQTPDIPLISATVLILVIIGVAKIPAGSFLHLLIIPAGFTFMSVAVILFLNGGTEIIWKLPVTSGFALSITRESVNESIIILAHVFGGLISLLFLSLTTPFTDIIKLMNQCRIPPEIGDLMTILYRTIFILLNHATQIYTAQVMRLGYSKPKEAMESFGMLCGSLFISSWNAGDDLIRAMDCRCYEGKFASLFPVEPVRGRSMIPVILFLCLLSAILILHTIPGPSGGF